MPGGVFFSAALSVALAASPTSPPRLILSLQKGSPGKVTAGVENVSREPVVLDGRTYLALLRETAEGVQAPVYWGEVSTPRLPSASAPLRLAAGQKIDVALDLRALLWSPDRSGFAPGHTLARGVRPGHYELQVQIVDQRGAWWRSSGIPIKVLQGGGITW